MFGSEQEPSAVPQEAAQQMRDATRRLRRKGGMVAPLTKPPSTTCRPPLTWSKKALPSAEMVWVPPLPMVEALSTPPS